MALNPLNELKRKLEDDSIPLTKRLCLAKNVIQTHYFPANPKEKIVSNWLEKINEANQFSENELKNILQWINIIDEPTNEFKSGLIKLLHQYILRNIFNLSELPDIISLLNNEKIQTQLHIQMEEFLSISKILLQKLSKSEPIKDHSNTVIKLLNDIKEYYKNSKNKLEFITKFLSGDYIETVFNYIYCKNVRACVLDICQTILFPLSKKSFYISFLQTLIKNENIDNLVEEKGENIQSVLKIMSSFFTFPSGRVSEDYEFLLKFMAVFVSSYRTENQLIFMFYIMAVNSLNMQQNYLNPTMIMPHIGLGENSEKQKRKIFWNMLEYLIDNEVDISVTLTETFGEKSSKVDVKKNFLTFLQTVMLGQIKLEGKIDRLTCQIIKSALKLDPMLIEPKMDQMIPSIMASKKNNHTIESYMEMLEYLLEVLFKLSRGIVFVNRMLPHIKIILEAGNTEQFTLKQKVEECRINGESCEKIEAKIITGEDVFPKRCVEKFGRLTSELMFRQNVELLLSLQRDFEDNCIFMLEEGFVSPSIITITEVMSAILSSFFEHSKMADHTVPENIAQEFWKAIDNFEKDFMKKFGECILKLNHNPALTLSFLKLAQSLVQLKILNYKYSNVKSVSFTITDNEEVLDLNLVLSCLDTRDWINMADRAQEHEAVNILDNLLLSKIIVMEILANENDFGNEKCKQIDAVRAHLIKQSLNNNSLLENNPYFSNTLLANLNNKHTKQASKGICKILLSDPMLPLLKNDAIMNNKQLLSALVMETLKNIVELLEKSFEITEFPCLSKTIAKTNFTLEEFLKEISFDGYFQLISKEREFSGEDLSLFTNCLQILKQLKIPNMDENCQLSVVFVLIIMKKACENKKVRKNVDDILQSIFELSKCPDLYKIYPIDFIFNFENEEFLRLATLSGKTNSLLLIKSILGMTLKKVKTDSGIVKNVVKILLTKQKHKKESNIECFSDSVFQITCLILPLILKEKKSITTSAYRSILADLQEKLHKSLLKTFKNVDFSNCDLENDENCSTALNAMEAYSLTLSKYCESNDTEAVKDLDCLWSALKHFVQIAIMSIQKSDTKINHVNVSIHLINTVLRYIKKLDTHEVFQNKDVTFLNIWQSLKTRLLILSHEKNVKYKQANNSCLEDIFVAIKFLCELSSIECFRLNFVEDLSSMMVMKKPSSIENEINKSNSTLATHLAAKKMWKFCLKSNITGPKCAALARHMYRNCKNEVIWIRNNYDMDNISFKEVIEIDEEKMTTEYIEHKPKCENSITISDVVCEIIKADVDSLCEMILASKKISLDYKFMDAVFELQQMLHFILGLNPYRVTCDISWESYCIIQEGSVSLLNSLLLAREELLEDRWPCFLQNYRVIISSLCQKSSSMVQLDKMFEERLAEIAHTIEKLTHSLSKKKSQISRLAAYTVADICYHIEKFTPSKYVRQHLENSVILLIQATDTNHAMAFLRRALAGSSGQATLTSLYTMYKRYHKYVGNA